MTLDGATGRSAQVADLAQQVRTASSGDVSPEPPSWQLVADLLVAASGDE